jgi:hypothetical protein
MILKENVLKNIIREIIEDFVDEANYPSSFNMEEFKGLTSFAARLRYCKQHLEPIASGSGRYVFGIDADTVLKLAKNQKGIAQNETEYDYANDSYITIIADVYDADQNGFLWIEMERLSKCTPSKFKAYTGMSINDFGDALRYFEGDLVGKKWWRKPENYEQIVKNEFYQDVQDLIGSYDMPAGDLMRLSSYGVTKDGQVKLVDAGLSQEVWNSFYRKR